MHLRNHYAMTSTLYEISRKCNLLINYRQLLKHQFQRQRERERDFSNGFCNAQFLSSETITSLPQPSLLFLLRVLALKDPKREKRSSGSGWAMRSEANLPVINQE